MDQESKEILTEGQRAVSLVKSNDWAFAKGKLEEKFKILDSYSSLPDGLNREQKLAEMERRADAISLVMEWITDLEGLAAQHEANNSEQKEEDHPIILRLDS